MLHACVLLLTTRLHPHHAAVRVRHTVGTTYRCEHGGALGGALALGTPVRRLHAVGSIGAVRLFTRLCKIRNAISVDRPVTGP